MGPFSGLRSMKREGFDQLLVRIQAGAEGFDYPGYSNLFPQRHRSPPFELTALDRAAGHRRGARATNARPTVTSVCGRIAPRIGR